MTIAKIFLTATLVATSAFPANALLRGPWGQPVGSGSYGGADMVLRLSAMNDPNLENLWRVKSGTNPHNVTTAAFSVTTPASVVRICPGAKGSDQEYSLNANANALYTLAIRAVKERNEGARNADNSDADRQSSADVWHTADNVPGKDGRLDYKDALYKARVLLKTWSDVSPTYRKDTHEDCGDGTSWAVNAAWALTQFVAAVEILNDADGLGVGWGTGNSEIGASQADYFKLIENMHAATYDPAVNTDDFSHQGILKLIDLSGNEFSGSEPSSNANRRIAYYYADLMFSAAMYRANIGATTTKHGKTRSQWQAYAYENARRMLHNLVMYQDSVNGNFGSEAGKAYANGGRWSYAPGEIRELRRRDCEHPQYSMNVLTQIAMYQLNVNDRTLLEELPANNNFPILIHMAKYASAAFRYPPASMPSNLRRVRGINNNGTLNATEIDLIGTNPTAGKAPNRDANPQSDVNGDGDFADAGEYDFDVTLIPTRKDSSGSYTLDGVAMRDCSQSWKNYGPESGSHIWAGNHLLSGWVGNILHMYDQNVSIGGGGTRNFVDNNDLPDTEWLANFANGEPNRPFFRTGFFPDLSEFTTAWEDN